MAIRTVVDPVPHKTIQSLYPGKIDIAINQRLIGNQAVINALASGQDRAAIERKYQAGLQDILRRRAKYLYSS